MLLTFHLPTDFGHVDFQFKCVFFTTKKIFVCSITEKYPVVSTSVVNEFSNNEYLLSYSIFDFQFCYSNVSIKFNLMICHCVVKADVLNTY